MCAEGWAMWAPGGSPDLPKATGGTRQLGKPTGRTFWQGLLLGRLGGAQAVHPTARPHADRALGNSEEESGCGPRRDRPVPDELRGPARPFAGAPIS